MDVGAVELELKKLGYEIKKIQGNNIDFIAADRVGALQDLATKFRGKYNPAGGSSSIGRTELPGGVKLNGWQIFESAQQEIDKLEEEMQLRYTLPPQFIIG